jgi:hypothetical protein
MEADEKWMMPAKLLNISADGGLVSPGILVSTGRRICLLFQMLPQAGWIDAEVVRVGGPNQVGIRFLPQMSPEFLQAAMGEPKAQRNDDSEGKTPYLGDAIPIW